MVDATASTSSAGRATEQPTLSLLDLCKRSRSATPRQSLDATLHLAMLAERLGYKRFWIAEHHTPDAAQASPEVLLPLIASHTTEIRVGAGGILLPYYSPLKVAEIFLVLEALFPGRIDLGVCRGPGIADPEVGRALAGLNSGELPPGVFETKVAVLLDHFRSASGEGHGDGVAVTPLGVGPPPVWILGAGAGSVRLALQLKRPYAYSLLFGGGLSDGLHYLAQYHDGCAAIADGCRPQCLIAVSVVCAESEQRARACDSQLVAQGCYASNVVGTPEQCAETLRAFSALFDVDEIMVTTFVDAPRAREELFTHLAEELHA